MLQGLEHLLFQVAATGRSHLTRFHQLIQQSLEPLERAMQSSAAEGRREVIHHHGMATALGLRSLPRVIDDERIEMGDGPERQLGRTARAETHGFAWQPFGAAVLSHMQHQVRPVPLPQPQILREIAMGRRQIR